MERGEAASTGLTPVSPVRLGTAEIRRRSESAGQFAAGFWDAALRSAELDPTSIGLAGRYPTGTAVAGGELLAEMGWSVVDYREPLRRLRRSKTPWETSEIRRAAAGTVEAFSSVAATLAEARPEEGLLSWNGRPLTAGDLRMQVREALSRFDLDQPEGNIVSAGGDSALPHTQGDSARQLRASETIVVDLYPRGHLFADCTRTFCVGEPPTAVAEAHGLVVEALEKVTAMAGPDAVPSELQDSVCDLFEEAGWPTTRSHPETTRGYVHGLGHGVGFELHELPGFRSSSPLRAGDVITLEPGLYDPEASLGVRVEDLLIVQESGLENLTPLPVDLDPRSW